MHDLANHFKKTLTTDQHTCPLGIWSVGSGPFLANVVKFKATSTGRDASSVTSSSITRKIFTICYDNIVCRVDVNGLIKRHCNRVIVDG